MTVRSIKTSAVLLLLLTFTASGLAMPKAYAAGCSKTGCNGTDPAKTGCVNSAYLAKKVPFASTANGKLVKGLYMELWYSRSCGTNWVRVYNPYGGWAYKRIDVFSPKAYTEEEWDKGKVTSYSMQVYAPGSTPVQAGATLYDTRGVVRAYVPSTKIY